MSGNQSPMPATITQSPIDVERKDPGSGGRPFIVGLPAAVGAMKTGDSVNLAEVRVSYSPAVAWV